VIERSLKARVELLELLIPAPRFGELLSYAERTRGIAPARIHAVLPFKAGALFSACVWG
jgi:hypothetical protein